MEGNYGYGGNSQPVPTRTATESDHIVARMKERLDGIRNVAKRLDALSDRLAGPRPRELSKEGLNGASPTPQPFAHQMNNMDSQISLAISECQNALNALEAFV